MVSAFIKLLYYLRVILIIVANLYALKFCEQISLCVKRCIIIFSLNSFSQLFGDHSAEFLLATECTGNHGVQRANKAGGGDSFNAFVVIS